MIFFDRDAMESFRPKSLDESRLRSVQNTIDGHMRLPAKRRAQTDVPLVWKTPFEDDVLAALAAGSDNFCAFCVSKAPLSVYRFRPPAYADPEKPIEGKESYLWLAFNWLNLFPICAQCRPSNPNYFPVSGERDGYSTTQNLEKADLIFPGELTQPHRYFSITQSGSFIGITKRANATIDHFQLNAPEKVSARGASLQETLARVRQTGWEWLAVDETAQTSQGPLYLYLRRIAEKMIRQQGRRKPLTVDKIYHTMARLSRHENYGAWLSIALSKISDEDAEGDSSVGVPKAEAPPKLPSLRLARVALTTYKSLENVSFDIDSKLSEATIARLHAKAAETSIIPQAPCMLILGENATGKSSILEAIALALIPTDQRERLELDTTNLTLNPEYMGAPSALPVPRSDIEVTFHPEVEGAPPHLVGLKIDGSVNAKTPFEESGDHATPVPPVFAYGAHRLYSEKKRRSSLRHIETLFHNDRQLPKPETWLCKLNSHDLDQVASALRHIIQIDGDFHTIEIDKANNQCKINVEKTRPDGSHYTVPQRMDIVSSGYRAVFALVCDVLEGLMKHVNGDVAAARDTPAIVLIDEIEAHLHPRWKLQVITGLRRALPKVTFIITSHDPLCVRGMYNGEVVALNRYQNTKKEGLGMPERVEPVEGFENVETLTIEQLLTSELFQLLSTDNPEMDRSLAHAADVLSQGRSGTDPALGVMDEMDRILTTALPYGQTELARVVQEAVAEYLAERRDRDHDTNDAARKEAKEQIKRRLRELIS